MSAYLTPEITAALALLVCIFVFFAAPKLFWFFKGRLRGRKSVSILEIPAEKLKKSLHETLKDLKAPFAFEVAIHHLGKDVRYYLIVPKSAAKEAINITQAVAAYDYHLYHPKGNHNGFYFKSGDAWPDIDPVSLSLPRVNEVGEGFSLQLLVKDMNKDVTIVNFRVLASTPSPYQTQEILSEAKTKLPSFKLAKIMEPKNIESFIQNFNSRRFEEKEAIKWA